MVIGGPPTIVAMIANETRSPLNIGTAAAGARMIINTNPSQTLHHTGVLHTTRAFQLSSLKAVFQARGLQICLAHLFRASLHNLLLSLGRILLHHAPLSLVCWQDIVYVIENGSSCACSCNIFALHGQCEHSTFVDSLQIHARLPRIDLNQLPAANRRKGRNGNQRQHLAGRGRLTSVPRNDLHRRTLNKWPQLVLASTVKLDHNMHTYAMSCFQLFLSPVQQLIKTCITSSQAALSHSTVHLHIYIYIHTCLFI